MKSILPAITGVFLLITPVFAQDAKPEDAAPDAAATPDPNAKLKDLVGRINEKLSKAEGDVEPDLKPEIAEFDKLRADFKDGEEEAAAQATIMEAMLYLQVLKDDAKGKELIEELKAKYPNTGPGQKADQILTAIDKQAAAAKVRDSLKVGNEFPNFEAVDFEGKDVSVAGLKGKVVLIDFWATWCPPCRAEVPNVVAAYGKYHDKGFEVIGISLDRDKADLAKFIAENKMTWPQVYDSGDGGSHPLAEKYGIMSIPSTFLVGKDGKIIAEDLRGDALEKELAKALGGSEG